MKIDTEYFPPIMPEKWGKMSFVILTKEAQRLQCHARGVPHFEKKSRLRIKKVAVVIPVVVCFSKLFTDEKSLKKFYVNIQMF